MRDKQTSLVVDATFIAVVSAVASIAGLIFTYFKYIIKQNERLTTLESKMELIWHYMDENMYKVFHSPHTPELDALLKKMPDITFLEAQKLKCLLMEQNASELIKERRMAYGLYLARIDSLILDKDKKLKLK